MVSNPRYIALAATTLMITSPLLFLLLLITDDFVAYIKP